MKYRTPLSSVLGLGSSKNGVHHWWVQRLTAVALIPLTLWFAYSIVFASLDVSSLTTAREFIAQPVNAMLLILLTFTMLHHSQLGLQVIVEDYVHGALKTVTLIASKFAHIVAGIAGIYSIIIISIAGQAS
jgi:succinate dehydrogenase / fumarate reductase, membrane anchor subunit